MLNLYTLPDWALIGLSIWAMGSFIAGVFLYYYLAPLPTFHELKRQLLEIGNLAVLIVLLGLPYEALGGLETGIFPEHPYFYLRLGVNCFVGALSLYWAHKKTGSLFLLSAAVLTLPWFDGAMPWNLMAALVLLDIRLALLLPKAFHDYHEDITDRAIPEAVNRLDEGIFLCYENGEPVLVNRAMERVMKEILTTVIGNGNILWQALSKGNFLNSTMERVGSNFLFHMQGGRVYLLAREPFHAPDGDGWQITASNVTDLDRMNRELEEKNEALRKRNEEMKTLLNHVVELESRDTLRDIRYKVHDMMGQRISYLQQILNNKDYKNYGRIADLLSHLLADMEKEITVKPDMVLSELVAAYESLDIHISITGTLPRGSLGSLFVEIIREAVTNAILHGKASAVSITFTEENGHRMTVTDNGVGSPETIREGGGLTSIRTKVQQRGGTLRYEGGEHFTLEVEVPDEV